MVWIGFIYYFGIFLLFLVIVLLIIICILVLVVRFIVFFKVEFFGGGINNGGFNFLFDFVDGESGWNGNDFLVMFGVFGYCLNDVFG